MKLYSAHDTQAIEHEAIKQPELPSLLLMKRAGLFAFETLQHHFRPPNSITLLCGTGNNGGDGFIVAQLAAMAGIEVRVILFGQTEKITGDALIAYQEMCALGIHPEPFSQIAIEQADILIDALFGIGLNRPITGKLASQIKRINQTNKPVLALDTPSGLEVDSGAILGEAIIATHTCTFITHKLGLHTFKGPETAGKLHFNSLGIAAKLCQRYTPLASNHPLKYWLNKLPKRLASRHKGVAGTACLVGGNYNTMGAIQLAGLASLKVGAGLVKLITHSEHITAITQRTPEVMCYSAEAFLSQANLANVVAIGPGLGLDSWAQSLYQQLLDTPLPKVIDADALSLLAQSPSRQDQWVLTPHPGEAARLLHSDSQTVQNNRIAAIKSLQHQYGGVIVLKGNGTLIYDGTRMELCLAGNPGMAVGGMGDILTGAISGLIAQGLSPWNAACLGVSLHAHAGDVLAQQKGQPGMLPSELALIMSQLLRYQD